MKISSRETVDKLLDKFHSEIIRQVSNIKSCCLKRGLSEADYCLFCKYSFDEVQHLKKMIKWATDKLKEVENGR